MAQRTIVQLVDDITGKEIPDGDGESIEFTYQGTVYSIDLDAKNSKKYHDTMAFYVDHATKVGRSANVTSIRRGGKKNQELDLGEVRAWAEANGYEVSSRGRVKNEILEAFRAANA